VVSELSIRDVACDVIEVMRAPLRRPPEDSAGRGEEIGSKLYSFGAVEIDVGEAVPEDDPDTKVGRREDGTERCFV
jgi:hypothetical protein